MKNEEPKGKQLSSIFSQQRQRKKLSKMSEREPLLRESGAVSVAIADASSASSDVMEARPPRQQQQLQQQQRGSRREHGDEEECRYRRRRRWRGPLLLPCGDPSYESLGVCCSVAACFPCPLTWPCVWSHSHARLLSPLPVAVRIAAFSLFFLFVFVPWVVVRVPLSVARSEACAQLTDDGGGSIPRSTVVECLRLIKIDDVVFWVSVGLTAAALVVAGVLRFAVRRRHGIEGGCACSGCGGGGRRGGERENAAETNAKDGDGSDETSATSPSSSSFSSFFALVPLLFADVLTWLLCPACALCQEARTAAAWEREKRAMERARAAAANGGEEEEGEQEAPLLFPLEAPPVARAFDRRGEI